ncbi:ABC transporter substrate-binding protein [Microbacterium dextranolyticum]|uniref:Sugar ABC transporter substrate-binding protein n=1 Tax=Microbacterium dextranolyticum TaxID=36806 RepID=A0A9W6HKQ7_9MICO|nr:extracellular solute-binding protein [Microbacterium dextranolyticum]MBM7463904.1 raffinose/stachyose/melibiose transport system substrate-binding protein [Microbacterium dextranolyticum]GLJ94986.1 sugar ABC transporter substrate-binding protein [Microbacterium dextranolyticum]
MFSSNRKTKAAVAIAAAVVAALGVSGCSASGGGGNEDGKTLKVWWWENDDSALSAAWNKAIDTFKEKHPDVKVEFELKTYEQMQQSGQLLLDSDDAPDVLEYLKGNATAGVVSQAGLLTDLTDVAKERGWKVDNSVQAVGLYDNGLMGSGKRYGVTNYGEYVPVWYNKSLFDKYNLTVPTSVAGLEKDMQTFVDNGVTPLALGSADYPGVHLLYQLALENMDATSLAAYQRFDGDVDWSAWEKAAEKIVDWTNKGYISKNSTGIPAQDAGNAFIAGTYPIFYSGTWWAGQFDKEVKDFSFDQFLFPGTNYAPGSGGNLWVVPEKAKNKKLAYDFIDITMSDEIQSYLGESGQVPVSADASKITSPTGKLVTEQFNKLQDATDGGLAWYPDWPVAGLNDVLIQNTTALVQGTKTPQQAVESIQAAYDQGRKDAGH